MTQHAEGLLLLLQHKYVLLRVVYREPVGCLICFWWRSDSKKQQKNPHKFTVHFTKAWIYGPFMGLDFICPPTALPGQIAI